MESQDQSSHATGAEQREDAVAPPDTPTAEVAREPTTSPPYRRRVILALLVLTLVLGLWWGSGYVFAYTDDAYVTSDLVSVTPEVSGPIETVHVADNEWVSRGTPLITIDPVPFRLALEQAQAEESQAAAQLPIDRAQVEALRAETHSAAAAERLAASDLHRDLPLRRSGTIPPQALDRSRTSHDESLARLHATEAALHKATETIRLHEGALASAHAARLLAEWRLSRTQLVAPVEGYITHLAIRPGDMASTNHPAVAIVDAHTWRVVANYKEYYLRHLRRGHVARVWLDSHPWHLYRARIQGLAHGISRDQGNDALVPYVSPTVNWIRLQRRIPVRLTLIDSPGNDQLFMGADARVVVIY